MIHRWISPVDSACGITCQHHAVSRLKTDLDTGRSRCVFFDSSQSGHMVNWALAVISGLDLVVEAPQCCHRHRVLPALVVPFLTSLVVHIPHRGEFASFFTTHALSASANP